MSLILRHGALALIMAIGVPASCLGESLEDALVAVYKSNPTLLAQRASLRASDELVPEALGNWRPTVTINGGVGYNDNSTNSADGIFTTTEQHMTPTTYGVTITQPLYRGGRTEAQINQAEATIKAQRELLAVTEQSVFTEAITAYLDVVQAQELVALNRTNAEVLQRQLEATRIRFKAGEVVRPDVSQAESAAMGARAGLQQAAGTLQNARANYASVVGHPPGRLKAPGAPDKLPSSLDAAIGAARAANPDILAHTYAYEAAKDGVDLAAGELLPTVNLVASYTKAFDQLITNDYNRNAEALINITIPIYQEGVDYAHIRQQKQTVAQQEQLLEEARRDAVKAATQAWETLLAARARVQSLKSQIASAKDAFEGTQRESLAGARTVLDVLVTEQSLLTAQIDLTAAQHDEAVASYQLKGAIGQLTAAALKLPVALYDPLEHYQAVHDRWIGAGDPAEGSGEAPTRSDAPPAGQANSQPKGAAGATGQ